MERTLVLIKPDALQRNLMGEIIKRFEQKGLKIVGCKMITLDDALLDEHYSHHRDKPFFDDLKNFMKSSPVLALVLEAPTAIKSVRLVVGPTKASDANAGSIRGDLAVSPGGANLVHASDSSESAEVEIERFFSPDEIFSYSKIDDSYRH
jgi:nucleoside-diphosphate kinase